MPRVATTRAEARLFELAQFVLEMQLGSQDGAEVQIVHDAKFLVRGLGRRRQVDIYVSVVSAGREFRRMVEVQRRGKVIDQAFLDQVEGKMRQLRMDRATIVSEAGFSADVLARLNANPDIDGITMKAAMPEDLAAFKLGELPESISLKTDYGEEELPLGPIFRTQAVDGPLDALVAVAESRTLPAPGIIGLTVERGEGDRLIIGTWHVQDSVRALKLSSNLIFEEGTIVSHKKLPSGNVPEIMLSAKLDPT